MLKHNPLSLTHIIAAMRKKNTRARIAQSLAAQKLLGWIFKRCFTVGTIWLLVSLLVRLAVFYSGATSNNTQKGEPSIFSAEGIAAVADERLLKYLAIGWVLVLVSSAIAQLIVRMRTAERQWLFVFSNRTLDELSSASTHAAFAYIFSIVIVAQDLPGMHDIGAVVIFCIFGIIGFNVDHGQPDLEQERNNHVSAEDLGLKIDGLQDGSIIGPTQTVTGSLAMLPSPGYHLWAVRDWEELSAKDRFYPEMELTIESRNKSWKAGSIEGEKVHHWKAPYFNFGGEPEHQRAFEIIMVNDADHKKMVESQTLAKHWNALREKAQETFKVYPTPTMRWNEITAERCIRIIVQREKSRTNSAP